MDPEDLGEIISTNQKCIAETVRRFGGFVAKYMGDGVLVSFVTQYAICVHNPADRRERVMSVQDRKVVHGDIKPENPPERAAHYIDVPKMPWEATKFPGINIKVLYTDDTGITTALFKLDPGAVVPLHEHAALEQTYVIEGTLEDHEGVCGPGQFVWRPAGNQHEAVAPQGAVLLGFFLKPNRFAYGERFFTEKGER